MDLIKELEMRFQAKLDKQQETINRLESKLYKYEQQSLENDLNELLTNLEGSLEEMPDQQEESGYG